MQGERGPAGLQGEQGEQGPAGLQGEQGPAGPQGEQGPAGSQGLQGLIGATGKAGAVGPAGPQGEQGLTGATGEQGPRGEKGDQGSAGPGVGIDSIFIGGTEYVGYAPGNGATLIWESGADPQWHDLSFITGYPGNAISVTLAVLEGRLYVTVLSSTGKIAQTSCTLNENPSGGWPGNCEAFTPLKQPAGPTAGTRIFWHVPSAAGNARMGGVKAS